MGYFHPDAAGFAVSDLAQDGTAPELPLRVGVLGPVTIWRAGCQVTAGQPRQLAVLGVLASRANRVVSRAELVDAVWGDQPPASVDSGIYTYVAGLRRVLEPDRPRRNPERSRRAPGQVLVSSGGGYLLRLAPDGLDAAQFGERLDQARVLRDSGDPHRAGLVMDEALRLWRGQPFAGVPGPFAAAERLRLTELRTAMAEERAELMLAQGQQAAAVPRLATLVAEHPLRERARGLLMIALYRCGRQAEALRVFHDARALLAEDLGIDPGVELTRIHQQVLAMDPALDVQEVPGEPGPAVVPSAAQPEPEGEQEPVAGPSPAPAGPAPFPAQLPPEPPGFVGRAAQLRALHELLPDEAACPPRACGTALITGTAGAGKTTLAIRFARQAGPLFPDGQLYVNLRGFDPASPPMQSATALRWFLEALGVNAANVPSALEAQSALLRTLLDGKRMLLLLDNAHDADQVRPLLPGSPGCMVLVTSRSQLTGLVVEGAWPLPLDVLDAGEAAELVASRLGAARTAAESAAVAEIVERAAGLPLALSVACARAAASPALRLADLAAELTDARGRLDVLRTGEPTTDLRAVFSWSADKLSDPAARLFRLIGLHCAPDISVAAAASLAGSTRAEARVALAELSRASLLTEDAAGRFGCHDLLRAYAAELAAATLPAAERDLAGRRMLDYYLRSAHAAVSCMFPARGKVRLPAPLAGVSPEDFAGEQPYDAAVSWFGAEHDCLYHCVEKAAAASRDEYCWQLAWCWAPRLLRRCMWQELLAVQRTAALAAGRLGDRDALAHVHCDLGNVLGKLGDYRAAEEHLGQSLALFTDLGYRARVGAVRYNLSVLLAEQGHYDEALGHAVAALRMRRSLADHGAIASSENEVGWLLAHLGQPEAGLWYCRRALAMHSESGSRTGVADTLDSIAYAHGQLADFGQSTAHYERAIAMYRLLGDVQAEALSRLHLGDVQFAAGLTEAARESWAAAHALLAGIPGADTSQATARLRGDAAGQGHGGPGCQE